MPRNKSKRGARSKSRAEQASRKKREEGISDLESETAAAATMAEMGAGPPPLSLGLGAPSPGAIGAPGQGGLAPGLAPGQGGLVPGARRGIRDPRGTRESLMKGVMGARFNGGGSVPAAKGRDGIATRGKTKGRFV